jgi:hypothetical protein
MVRCWKSLSAVTLIAALTFAPAEAGQWIFNRGSAPSSANGGGHVENDDPNEDDAGDSDFANDGSLTMEAFSKSRCYWPKSGRRA